MEERQKLNSKLENLISQYEQTDNTNTQMDIVMQLIRLSKDDETKLKLLDRIGLEECVFMIIKSLESEDIRISQIDKLTGEYDRVNIIIGLKSDDKKIKLLDKVKEEYRLISVLCSVKDEEKRLESLQEITSVNVRIEVIKSIKNDDKKIELLQDSMYEDKHKAEILISIKDDDKKIKALECIKYPFNREVVIETIQDETKRILQIDSVLDYEARARLISTVTDVDKRIELLDKLKSEDNRYEHLMLKIITRMPEDKRITTLSKLHNTYYKLEVVKTLKGDEEKLQLLRQQEKTDYRAGIIMLLENDDLKMTLIDTIPNPIYRNFALLNLSKDNLQRYISVQPDNFLDIPADMTVGIEIETEGKNSRFIKLNEMMLHQWNVKDDISLGEDMGVEVTSPILTGTKEDTEQIYTVCEILSRIGQVSTDDCGGHIHIGSNYLDTKEAYIILMNIWCNTEKEIYLISNPEGVLPRAGIHRYAEPVSAKIKKAIDNGGLEVPDEEQLDGIIRQLQIVDCARTSGINFKNANEKTHTIEFRLPNGTLDAQTWIDNVNLFGGILSISKKLADIQLKQGELSETEKQKIGEYEKLMQGNTSEDKVNSLINLIFDDEGKKTTYMKRYRINCKMLEKMPDIKNPFKKGFVHEKINIKNTIKSASRDIRQGEIDETMSEILHLMQYPKRESVNKERE